MTLILEGVQDMNQFFILQIVYFEGSLFDTELESWHW